MLICFSYELLHHHSELHAICFFCFLASLISPILVHELDDTMVDFSLSQMLIAYCSIGSGNFCIHFRYLSCWMHFPVRD